MDAQISSIVRKAKTVTVPSNPALKKIEFYGIISLTYQHPITSQIVHSGIKISHSLIPVFHKLLKMSHVPFLSFLISATKTMFKDFRRYSKN